MVDMAHCRASRGKVFTGDYDPFLMPTSRPQRPTRHTWTTGWIVLCSKKLANGLIKVAPYLWSSHCVERLPFAHRGTALSSQTYAHKNCRTQAALPPWLLNPLSTRKAQHDGNLYHHSASSCLHSNDVHHVVHVVSCGSLRSAMWA